ncbi:helix-turn-helix domain-containing protein [Paenibacillus paridis]|uniref:helix-turn-helix domain-containing protein n=1 Tax=Paenibacillus paridis TaxID=2583376 RepID=UPI001120F2B6|nr:helix-turn-helix transcriptional regulator [Paenibacillus paridis]
MILRIKLKKILKERKMTQQQLSILSKVTQSKISNLCNNNLKELNIRNIERIATALDIEDITELLVFEKSEGSNDVWSLEN